MWKIFLNLGLPNTSNAGVSMTTLWESWLASVEKHSSGFQFLSIPTSSWLSLLHWVPQMHFLLYSLSLILTGDLYYRGDGGEAVVYQVPSSKVQALEVTTR